MAAVHRLGVRGTGAAAAAGKSGKGARPDPPNEPGVLDAAGLERLRADAAARPGAEDDSPIAGAWIEETPAQVGEPEQAAADDAAVRALFEADAVSGDEMARALDGIAAEIGQVPPQGEAAADSDQYPPQNGDRAREARPLPNRVTIPGADTEIAPFAEYISERRRQETAAQYSEPAPEEVVPTPEPAPVPTVEVKSSRGKAGVI